MPWLFLATFLLAIAGLVAYICLGREIWGSKGSTQKPSRLRKWGLVSGNFTSASEGVRESVIVKEPVINPETEASVPLKPYRWPDILFCLVLGVYFLKLMTASSEEESLLTLREIQAGTIFYLLLDVIILAFLLLRHIHPIKIFGFGALPWKHNFKLAAFWLIALYPLIFLIQLLVENLGGTHVTPQPLVQYLMQNPSFSDHIKVGLLAIVVAPFTEELIFRGYLYGVIRQYAGRLAALVVTSCIFAGIHQHLSAFPGLFLLGVALCLVYEATGCLTVPILMHAFFNLIGVTAAISGSFSS